MWEFSRANNECKFFKNYFFQVKDEIQNLSQHSNINILNTDNSFINNSNQIQHVENSSSNQESHTSNFENSKLVNIDFINHENKQPGICNEKSIVDNQLLSNNANQPGLNHNENINEYDFNFDPFDSNVLFNLNDMEFI